MAVRSMFFLIFFSNYLINFLVLKARDLIGIYSNGKFRTELIRIKL